MVGRKELDSVSKEKIALALKSSDINSQFAIIGHREFLIKVHMN